MAHSLSWPLSKRDTISAWEDTGYATQWSRDRRTSSLSIDRNELFFDAAVTTRGVIHQTGSNWREYICNSSTVSAPPLCGVHATFGPQTGIMFVEVEQSQIGRGLSGRRNRVISRVRSYPRLGRSNPWAAR